MRICFAIATLALAGVSFAQDLSLKDALSGTALKPRIAIKDLPESYRAVKIGSGESDYLSTMMPLMFMGGGPGGGPGNPVLAGAISSSWTDGTVVSIEGQRFLVTYKMDLDMSGLAGRGAPTMPGSDLSLQLIRVDSIKSLAPAPNLTKQTLLQALSFSAPAEAMAAVVEGAAPASAMMASDPDLAAKRTATTSNLKQAALAVLMYCGDYDDVYPYVQNTATVREVTMPYSKNAEIWKTYNPRGGRVLFNMALAGAESVAIPNPAEMPMLYDETPWADGSRVVAFADGHVAVVQASGWPKLAQMMKQRFKPKGKPLPAVKSSGG